LDPLISLSRLSLRYIELTQIYISIYRNCKTPFFEIANL